MVMTACSCYRFFTCTACTAVSMLTPKRSHISAMRNASIPPWWVAKWRRTSPNVVDGVPRSIHSPVPHNLPTLIKWVGKTTHKNKSTLKRKTFFSNDSKSCNRNPTILLWDTIKCTWKFCTHFHTEDYYLKSQIRTGTVGFIKPTVNCDSSC